MNNLKFPSFYGTQRFISVFTTVRHWSLFCPEWIYSTILTFLFIHQSTSRVFEWYLSFSFPHRNFVCSLLLSSAFYLTPPSLTLLFDCANDIRKVNFLQPPVVMWSQNSSVGIANGYGLEDGKVGFRVPVGQEFSLLHVVQTGSGVHSTSYTMGTRGSFLGGKVVGARSWPLTSN
jgi:hypothetical protein